MRENADDVLSTLFPDTTYALKQRALTRLNLAQYGSHVDYKVLNRMYQALAPPQEKWCVEIELLDQYFVQDLDAVQMVFSKESRDILILARLENASLVPDTKRAKKLTMDDLVEEEADDVQLAGSGEEEGGQGQGNAVVPGAG